MRNTRPEFAVPTENIPVTLQIGNWCELCKYAAPDGIPAVNPDIIPAVVGICNNTLHIADIRMTIVFLFNGFIYGNNRHNILVVCFFIADRDIALAFAVIEPDCCPCQFIIVVAGLIEAAVIAQRNNFQTVTFLMGIHSHFVKVLCALEAFFRIFRIRVHKIQVVDCERSRCACTHIGSTGIGLLRLCFCRKYVLFGCKICRSCKIKKMLTLQIRTKPIVMVDITLADLINIGKQLTVLIVIQRLQIEIAKRVENILHMFSVSGFFICFAKFIISPAQRRCCIGTGQTEFYVVTCIVHTAFAIESTIPIRIKLLAVFLNPLLRQIDSLEILAILFERNFLILHMTVSTPFQSAGTFAALICIIEMQCVLETLSKIHFYVIIGKTVGIRELLVSVIDSSRILACRRKSRQRAGTKHHSRKADA